MSIPIPTGDVYPHKLISLNEGLPSNIFILQDNKGVSLGDINFSTATVIQSLEGSANKGNSGERKDGKLIILTNLSNAPNSRVSFWNGKPGVSICV